MSLLFKNSKRKYLLLPLLLVLLISQGCPDGTVCVFSNKTVAVENNTGFNLSLRYNLGFNSIVLGSLTPFEAKAFSGIPYNAVLVAFNNTHGLNKEFFVDPCINKLSFIVED